MTCCNIYNQPFYKDLKDINAISNNVSNFPKLEQFISIVNSKKREFHPQISGVWLPIVINTTETDAKYVSIFRRSILETSLNPCACTPINQDETLFEAQVLDCNYCNLTPKINNTINWTITDTKNKITSTNIVANYCSGANDVRMYPDDYLTKLPSLCNSYLTGIYDFKYLNQFPAASNRGLGLEEFVSIPIDNTNFRSLSSTNLKLCIDWKIQEKLGETEPNPVDSYYDFLDDHNKAYNRYLANNKTCGNFILLSPNTAYNNTGIYPRYTWIDNCIDRVTNNNLTDTQLPSPDHFTIPFGFKNQDHYNIFTSGNDKIGSCWKWNYSSGILCWYRYADRDIPPAEDKRIIPGLDLYISEGDVFYAKNDGPEPLPGEQKNIKLCPSGLKLIAPNKTVSGVIPSESEFVYVSQNLYHKVRSLFYKIHTLELDLNIPASERKTPRQKLELACLLGTCPNYDEITVDMLLNDPPNTTYARKDFYQNDYRRIDLFNQQMLQKPNYGAANDIGIIKTKQDLLNTLANKYGCYILFPPGAKNTLNIELENESHILFDLDFEPVINAAELSYNANAVGKVNCADTTINYNFYYDQTIGIGQSILSTKPDAGYFDQSCSSGVFTSTSAVNTSSIYFSDTLLDTKAYSTGAVSLDHIYLRPQSYDLALKLVGESICSAQSLCNKQLAVKYNNQNNLWGTPQEKKEGEFPDDSVRLQRGYPACFFNPNINLCAFHKDGGVYYDSNNFGQDKLYFSKKVSNSTGRPYVSFDNKQIGIKLYSLKIDKLRDNLNPECKTLPLTHVCKCFDLVKEVSKPYPCNSSRKVFSNRSSILYTPNLSTGGEASVSVKSYGDFSLEELMFKFNNSFNPIPNHPAPKTALQRVNKIIDPLNPYECSKSISFTLPNYVYTKWNIGLDQYTTNHTDIWATVNQSINVVSPTIVVPVIQSDSNPGTPGVSSSDVVVYEQINNPNYRRYINKVEFYNGSLTLYNQQKNILFSSDTTVSNLFDIQITNPYLYALLESAGGDMEKNKLLYAPFNCHSDGNGTYSETRNYIHNINIVLEQIPRKHLLMYKMYPIQGMGTLTPSFFHPNSGIKDDMSNLGTSLIFYKSEGYYDFLYEQELFEDGRTPYNTNGIMYRGDLNNKTQFVLDAINLLNSHKKLRLYLKYKNDWYEYINPHIFGFYNEHNQNTYPGAPAYFEYTNFDKPKALLNNRRDLLFSITNANAINQLPPITQPSTLIPASPKINTKFNYTSNDRLTLNEYNYPELNLHFIRNKDNPKSIILESIRPYFLFDDYTTYVSVSTIEGIPPDDETISEGTVIRDKDSQYWRYNTGLKNQKYSYELLYSPNYYDSKFSNLHFSINANTLDSDGGVIHSSIMSVTPTSVILYDKQDPTFNTKQSYVVIGKYITAIIVDKYGNPIDTNKPILDKKYAKIQTVLVLDMCEECSLDYFEGYIEIKRDTNPPTRLKNVITLYQNLERSLYGEFSSLLSNGSVPYQTKWGDLIYYDYNKNFDLNNSLLIQSFINHNYPSGLYANIFDSLIINQNRARTHQLLYYINKFIASGQPPQIVKEKINYKGQVNYTIHQKYNIDSDTVYELNTSQYENFLPLIDLCFIDYPEEGAYGPVGQQVFVDTQLYDITNTNSNNYIKTTGDIYISGVRTYTSSGLLTKNPKDYGYFILSLDKKAVIKPVLFNQEFYHHTLRVDDVYFPLLRNKVIESYTLASGCNNKFYNNTSYDLTDQEIYFSTQNFDRLNNNIQRPYFQTPIYCDSNTAGDPCYNQFCSFQNIGSETVTSEYQHLVDMPKIFEDIADGISEYAFGIDEGLYNFTHRSPIHIPYIQRFEIPPNDHIFNESSDPYQRTSTVSWSQTANLQQPISTRYSYINQKYQNQLIDYLNHPQSDLVKNTDILANEMLFRSIYGSKQKISLETIKKKTIEEALAPDTISNPWSFLLQYADTPTTPDKIYSLIPYDYDKNADQSRRKISGSISIQGVAATDKSFSVNINNKVIEFKISQENDTIYLVATVGSKTIKKQLGQLFSVSEHIFATQLGNDGKPLVPVQESSDTTTIVRIDTCEGEELLSWSAGAYFTSMQYTGGDGKVVDLVAEYKKCVQQIGPGCANPPGVDSKVISYYVEPAPGGASCGFLCARCDSRGYAEGVSLPPNCQIINSTVKTINYNGLSRGNYVVLDELGVGCPPRQGSISVSPDLKIGDFDDVAGGIPVLQMTQANNCSPKAEVCKPASCHPIDATDKFGKVFDPKRAYINFSVVGSPCECRPFSFGYCEQGQSSCNECVPYAEGYPKSFDYSFENQYTEFDTTGYILRNKAGEPIVHNGKSFPDGVCGHPVGLTAPGDSAKHKAEERCYWVQCSSKTPSWGIYRSTTKTPQTYNPLCPSSLATITYNNNTTTIDLNGPVLCIDNTIRNDCPLIEITLPDNTFTFTDSIESECTMCDVEDNKIIMDSQNPEWDIITETRTAILGIIALETDLNENLTFGRGGVYVRKEVCGEPNLLCCYDGCFKVEGATLFQCGKIAPDSWAWSYALNCELNGSPDPTFGKCIHNFIIGQGTGYSSLVNSKGRISFESTSSNKSAAYAHRAHWEKRMATAYKNTQPCKNNNDINKEDIVEGIVPGSCGQLQFAKVGFPATAFRQTLDGGQSVGITYTVDIAYYTYEYRRPRTIDDVLLGDDLAKQCKTINPYPASNFSNLSAKNMAEKYAVKIDNCQKTPTCYDTIVPWCNNDNYCCLTNKTDGE